VYTRIILCTPVTVNKLQVTVTTKQHSKKYIQKGSPKKIKRTHIFMIIFLYYIYFIILLCPGMQEQVPFLFF
jgi:mannose/fructose/N-acetylgalactosamine-specific phosphotransferase system component IIC